jgi:hypothetical protein
MGLKENKNLSELSKLYLNFENRLAEWNRIDEIKKSTEDSLRVQLIESIDALTSDPGYEKYSTKEEKEEIASIYDSLT